MKTSAKKPESQSHTPDSDTQSSRQEPDSAIDSFLEELIGVPVASYEIDHYKKAHGEDVKNTKEITDAQRTYQNWLSGKIGSEKIMDTHRSVGFEYEFATYSIPKEGLEIDSHKEIGHSRQLSSLFSTPFKLETDSDNEIEIVTPPLIIADIDGEINKEAADNIYTFYKDSAIDLRDDNLGKKIKTINLVDKGFGNVWKFDKAAGDLAISAGREKHADSDDQIYSQMNISLTPGEISDFMDAQSLDWADDRDAETLEGTDLFSNAYFRILNLLEEGSPGADEVRTLNVLISRALSNILALPSIILNQEYRDKGLLDSKHSAVKETFGIWVKDTIQSILCYFEAEDGQTNKIVKEAVGSNVDGILEILEQELLTDQNIAFPRADITEEGGDKLQAEINKRNSDFADQVKTEARASITKIIRALEGDDPLFDYDTKFLDESFQDDDAGYGVRKDTYVEIPSGEDRSLHLAEIRGDETVEKFLQTEQDDESVEDDDLIIEWI